jgi:hypothetical protein
MLCYFKDPHSSERVSFSRLSRSHKRGKKPDSQTTTTIAKIPVTWNGTDAQGKPLLWGSGLTWNEFLPRTLTKSIFQLRAIGGSTG